MDKISTTNPIQVYWKSIFHLTFDISGTPCQIQTKLLNVSLSSNLMDDLLFEGTKIPKNLCG